MKLAKAATAILLAMWLLTACSSDERPADSADYSDRAELERARETAQRVFGLEFDEAEREGSDRNFFAIRSKQLLFSQRLDSRTYFIQDERYGHGREAGAFDGDDDELEKLAVDLFSRLQIPRAEIAQILVLQENSQVAREEKGTWIPEDAVSGRKLARLERRIDDIPVFSSKVLLGATSDLRIGYLELHWPEIPAVVLTEAKRLAFKVSDGWRAPEQKGARPESVEAGVVHSASAGFLMDIYPAIRVIYSPIDERMGRKLMLYFDRHGKTVPQPREFDLPCEEPQPPRKGRSSSGR